MRNSKHIITGIIFLVVISLVCGCMKPKKKEAGVVLLDEPKLLELLAFPKQAALNIERDPFKSVFAVNVNQNLALPSQPADVPRLIGIIYDKDLKRCIIKWVNQTYVAKVGDKINSYLLEEIGTDYITLKREDEQMIIKLGGKNEPDK